MGEPWCRSESDSQIDIELDLDIAAELALIPCHRLAGTLPAALLLALPRPRLESLAWVGDVVLHAVARSQSNTVLPHLTRPRPIGALTEGVPDPCVAGAYLALDELVADRGSFPCDLADRLLEPIALSAHLGYVPELAN